LICDCHLVMFVQVLKEAFLSGGSNLNHMGRSKGEKGQDR
jgi:hypothetical protein